MSLWHASGSKENEYKDLPALPELEPLPELDDLFDEFDSGGLLSEDSKYNDNKVVEDSENNNDHNRENEVFESEQVNEMQRNEEVRLPEKTSNMTSDHSFEDFLDYEEKQESKNVSNENDDDEYLEETKDYGGDIDIPDMSFETFETIDQNELYNSEYDRLNDEEVINGQDDEDLYGYELEGAEVHGTLLPVMEEDEEKYNEVEDYKEEIPDLTTETVSKDNNINKKSKPAKKKSGFKELDDEKVKSFFTGLFGKFKRNKKNKNDNANKEKNVKEKSVNKKKQKINNPGKSSSKIKLDKTKIIILGTIAAVLVLLVVLYFMWGNSYKSIDDIESTIKMKNEYDEEVNVDLSDLSVSKKNLELKLMNNGDLSQDFSMYITVKTKSAFPLLGDKITCESDIIAMEPGLMLIETLKCDSSLKKDAKYKILDIEVDEL